MKHVALWIGLAFVMLAAQIARAMDDRMAGNWTLNFDQSENLGPNRLDLEMTVSLDGENLALTRKGKIEGRDEPLEEAYTYRANGEEHTVTGAGGNSRQVRARWVGDKLKVTWAGAGRFGPFDAVEIWEIKNGQIYIKTTLQGAAGSFTMKSFYDRRKPPDHGG
jgi:hypothetical protein